MNQCDLATGLCGPADDTTPDVIRLDREPRLQVLYITDPICSACWAMEPAWRRFLFHYGEQVEVRHLYGGLLPRWEGFADVGAGIRGPADLIPHWQEMTAYSGQPTDPRVWSTDPLDSSYPPSIALHTVRSIAPEQEERYLRRFREALFLENKNIARPEVLAACAADIGLDGEQFATLYAAGIGKAGFQRDLQDVRRLPVRGFPTLLFVEPDGNATVLRGTQPFANIERAFLSAAAAAPSTAQPAPEAALHAYESGTTREFAELLGLSTEATERALEAAGAVPAPVAGSYLWRAAQSVGV